MCLTRACELNDESLISAIVEPNESIVTKSGKIINDLLHREIKKIGKESNISLFNFENRIATINSLLWQFITVCTTPIKVQTRQQEENHTKNVRKHAIISMLMLATKPVCNTELHQLVADAIEVCGGSRKLLRIMNRLGICVMGHS